MKENPPAGIYVVMGLARSGLAAARLLLRHGCRVRITDLKPADAFPREIDTLNGDARENDSPVEFHLGGHPPAILDGAAAVVLSPGIPLTAPLLHQATQAGIPVWSEVELAFRFIRGTVWGITGSNGKSTTTALTAHILAQSGRKAFAVGNIGQALADFLDQDGPETIFVTELSSFQLETIDRFHPRLATILNITQNHLDRYVSMEEYATAKWNLFRNMGPADAAILNARDTRLVQGAAALRCPVHYFDSRPADDPARVRGAGVAGGSLWLAAGGAAFPFMPQAEIPLPGRHNLENVLAAALFTHLGGISPEAIRAGVRTFQALPHRLEPVAEIQGRFFYNDSKATTVESTLYALHAFEQKILLILGGKDKGSDFAPLVEPVRQRVKHCLLIGKATGKISRALGADIPQTMCSDLNHAIRLGFELSAPGDVILLSPACASFDMFDNFEHRGEVFRHEVLKLKSELT